jgi:hypothetical protein
VWKLILVAACVGCLSVALLGASLVGALLMASDPQLYEESYRLIMVPVFFWSALGLASAATLLAWIGWVTREV